MRRGGECGVGSRVGDGKRRVTVNSLITGVAVREIVLSGSGSSLKILSVMAMLNGLDSWQ